MFLLTHANQAQLSGWSNPQCTWDSSNQATVTFLFSVILLGWLVSYDEVWSRLVHYPKFVMVKPQQYTLQALCRVDTSFLKIVTSGVWSIIILISLAKET